MSVLTLAEIRFGVELLPPGKRRAQLQEWLEDELPEWFDGRVLFVDDSIAQRWGVLRAQAQIKGRPLSVIDGLLAATAQQHSLTIVSRNSRRALNPFQPEIQNRLVAAFGAGHPPVFSTDRRRRIRCIQDSEAAWASVQHIESCQTTLPNSKTFVRSDAENARVRAFTFARGLSIPTVKAA